MRIEKRDGLTVNNFTQVYTTSLYLHVRNKALQHNTPNRLSVNETLLLLSHSLTGLPTSLYIFLTTFSQYQYKCLGCSFAYVDNAATNNCEYIFPFLFIFQYTRLNILNYPHTLTYMIH